MVPGMTGRDRTRPRGATGGRTVGGQWPSTAVPALLRPACWWALLIGAPPAGSI
jgi:hypothetical protein